jgi:hypothetical protein
MESSQSKRKLVDDDDMSQQQWSRRRYEDVVDFTETPLFSSMFLPPVLVPTVSRTGAFTPRLDHAASVTGTDSDSESETSKNNNNDDDDNDDDAMTDFDSAPRFRRPAVRAARRRSDDEIDQSDTASFSETTLSGTC